MKGNKGKAGRKPSQKLIVFRKLHGTENWNLELKYRLTPKYNKIVNFIKCILERVNENYKAWCDGKEPRQYPKE